jgi:hypothetical protein
MSNIGIPNNIGVPACASSNIPNKSAKLAPFENLVIVNCLPSKAYAFQGLGFGYWNFDIALWSPANWFLSAAKVW